jgi:hypothetical protein
VSSVSHEAMMGADSGGMLLKSRFHFVETMREEADFSGT